MIIDLSVRHKIRSAYERARPILMKGIRLSPYDLGIDWFCLMSPIEDNVWDAIRFLGLPLYPQYPVGSYFVDFGDPFKRIGIEVDSIAWHMDRKKDIRRQKEIENMGWQIFRISSRMTYKSKPDFIREDDNGREILDVDKFITQSAEGFLRKIYQGIKY